MGQQRLPALVTVAMLATLSGAPAAGAATGEVHRVAGEDRIQTAVRIARETFNTSKRAFLATARNYPDALAGSVLAHKKNAPLLLVDPDEIPQTVLDVFDDLGVSDVTMLGGRSAISKDVQDQLVARFGTDGTHRIYGNTRYNTASGIADAVVGGWRNAPDTVVLATGQNFPDAVAASALAASRQWPVIDRTRPDERPRQDLP